MLRNAIVLFATFTLAACGGSDSDDGELVMFETLDCPGVASDSAYEEQTTQLFNSEQAFRQWYLASNLDDQVETPSVDFDRQTVVAINTGQKATLGYSVEVTEIRDRGDELMVHYQDKGPLSCSAATAVSYPYCFVVIDKPDKPVRFDEQVVDTCE